MAETATAEAGMTVGIPVTLVPGTACTDVAGARFARNYRQVIAGLLKEMFGTSVTIKLSPDYEHQ